MIASAIKMPTGIVWQLAIWQFGNFPVEIAHRFQRVEADDRLPAGNLATSVLAICQSKCSSKSNGLSKLPNCQPNLPPTGGGVSERLKTARSPQLSQRVRAISGPCFGAAKIPTITFKTEVMMNNTCLTIPASNRSLVSPMASSATGALLALDLGTMIGWALRATGGQMVSGTASFRPSGYDGGGMHYLRFRSWPHGLRWAELIAASR
jgi:hypothetical protein